MTERRLWLCDHRGRTAVVALVPRRRAEAVHHRDHAGSPVRSSRFIKATAETTFAALLLRHGGPDALGRALVAGDPELDLEACGREAGPCDRVYVDGKGRALYAARIMDVICDRDGKEIERRPPEVIPANLVPDAPPVWSGKFLPASDAARRFAFTRAYQVRHTNGLEYDFLHGLAVHLEKRDRLVLVGSGPRGLGPLVPERNAAPVKGMLFGQTRGASYRLILYLAAFELRPPGVA